MTRPLSEVLADVDAALHYTVPPGMPDHLVFPTAYARAVMLLHECRDLLAVCAAEHQGPTWDASSAVVVMLPDAERVLRYASAAWDRQASDLEDGSLPGDRGALTRFREAVETARVRVKVTVRDYIDARTRAAVAPQPDLMRGGIRCSFCGEPWTDEHLCEGILHGRVKMEP